MTLSIKNIFSLLTKITIFPSLLFIFSCSHQDTLKRNNGDQYWEQLHNKALENNSTLLKVIELENPNLFRQINDDAKDSVLTNFWGRSYNFDSGAKKTILNHQLIKELQAKFQIQNDNEIVHAGIMHTYGYLFSILNTPYGYKRKRWVDPTLSYGFNFKNQSLSPLASEGGLLSNATYFFGKLAFSEKANLEKLNLLSNVSNEVKNFSYTAIKRDVLEESITNRADYPFLLRTTLVKFEQKTASEENDYLLIYSYLNLKTHEEVLITGFPIKKDAYLKTLDNNGLGDDRPIIVRYNGFLTANKEVRFSGKRLIFNK